MPSEKRKARKQNYFKAAKQSRKVQEVRRESMALFCENVFDNMFQNISSEVLYCVLASITNRLCCKGKVLKEGMRGFLITCNNREREAVSVVAKLSLQLPLAE